MLKTFQVTIEETAQYTVGVVARNRAEAEERAEAVFLQGITCSFPTEVTERDIIDVGMGVTL